MTLPGPVKRSSNDLLTSFLYDADANPPDGWTRSTGLYRLFDAQGDLLYLGITKRLRRRMTEHARDYAETWWPLVASRTVQWYESRTEAGRAERAAIVAERPPHNVLHTPRHRVPLQLRRAGNYGGRGSQLIEIAEDRFNGEPFTAADALAVSTYSKATVTQWIKALSDRNKLVRVGTRHCVSKVKGVPIREHSLYALPASNAARSGQPIHQWIDVSEMSRPPSPRRGTSTGGGNRWQNRYPGGREMSLLRVAAQAFPEQPFTFAQLAQAVGMDVQSIAKYLRKLRQNGLLVQVGKAHLPAGTPGHRPVLYVVSTPEAAAQTVDGAQ